MAASPRIRDFISLDSFSRDQILEIVGLAKRQKMDPGVYRYLRPLMGKTVGLFFEKTSLRTRISFEVAISQLGGTVLYYGPETGVFGQREPVKDFAKVSARYLDAIVLRTHRHEAIVEAARSSEKPVINALSNERHPCQALADLLTIREKTGRLEGAKIAYLGDANNVCRSLAVAAAKVGAHITIASPKEYSLPDSFLKKPVFQTDNLHEFVTQVEDPIEAVQGVDVIYTDTWVSEGREEEAEKRRSALLPYQLNEKILVQAPKAFVFHCLPARRGEEVTDQVLDGNQSVIYDQAENKLHAQRALLTRMLGNGNGGN